MNDWKRSSGVLVAVLLIAALTLGACGKKGNLRPPDENESEYTYPRVYPAPESVVPALDEPDEPPEASDDGDATNAP